MMVLLKKPIFWIVLILIIIIILIILVFEPKSPIAIQTNQQASQEQSSEVISPALKKKLIPGDCLIFEEKYCRNGKLVEWKNPSGQVFKLISFSLPKEVPILAPFDGTFTYSDGPGNLIDPKAPAAVVYKPISESDPTNLTFMITGDIKFDKEQTVIKKGDQVAVTGNSEIRVLEGTIAILITRIENSKISVDENLLNKFLNKK